MRKVVSFLFAMSLLMLPLVGNAEWGGQCSFTFVASCGAVHENFTIPCDWIGDEELLTIILDEADDYLCPEN